ncbi:hypothetical protein ElyMa_006737200 [Elysia marginata]|uniref:Uncharacterized protein n=1 Tax=Elysia marginata TaxID=1093978 RepID=A0AAV4IZY1_9GAST|nr:hypothetical protein ElyMa_006737200 [Elysia marginata]
MSLFFISSTDDSDKLEQSQTSALVDVNGNPTPLSSSVYSQMRQSPYSSSSSAQHSNSSNTTTTTASNSSSGGHGGSQTASSESELTKRQKRRDSKLNKQKAYQAVQYDDLKFKEDTSIDEILSFIQDSEAAGKTATANTKAGRGKKQGGKKVVSQEVPPATEDKVEVGKVVAKKKQGTKKDTPALNGQLSAEETELGDYRITLEAMGNSVSANCDSGENTAPSVIENLEESLQPNQGSLLSEETVKTNKDHNKKENKKQYPSSPKENTTTKSAVKEESSGPKESSDGNNKLNNNKKTKSKQPVAKKDSTDSVSQVNGPLSPPATMVKSSQNSVDNVKKTEPTVSEQTSPDLESGPKKEEVFVEVKKKKKRVGPKESGVLLTSSNAPFVPNQFYSRTGNGVSGQSGFRNNGYQRQPRSSTPLSFPTSTTTSLASSTISTTYMTNATTTPIVSSSNTTLSISSNSSSSSGVEHHIHPPRDLSPSAFPVLEGHSLPPTGTEARRNSCGDATDLLVESKSLCDSDRESVKSLPATSPMYPISYARMAAGSGPKRNNNSYPESIASPSSESGLGWQNSSNSSVTHTPTSSCHATSPGGVPAPHTPERKASTAVWKGSPRERRHSIGSSPAEEKINPPVGEESSDTSMASRNRQKSGSQEFLNRDLNSVSSTAPTEVKVAVVKPFQTSESSSSLQSDSNLSEDAMGLCFTHASRDVASSSHVKFTASSVPYATSKTSSPNTSLPSKQAESVSSVPSQTSSAQKNTDDETADSAVGKKTIPHMNKSGSSSSTSSRTNTSASGGNNSKSVVFLDKRFTSTPTQSLGITFGFDSSFDSTTNSTGKEEKDNSEKVPEKDSSVIHSAQVTVTVSSLSSSSSSISSSSPSNGQLTGSQPQARAHNIPPSIPPPVPGQTQQPDELSASDKKVPKGPHIERLPNGLIVPSHNQQPQQHQSGRGQPTTTSIVSNSVSPQVRPARTTPVVGPGLVIPFCLNYPPPPLPQGHAVVTSTGPPVALPPQGSSTAPCATLPESQDYRKLGCLPDISQPPPQSTLKTGPAQPGLVLPLQLPPQHHNRQQQQQLQQQLEGIPVVYGLKIKPNGGCGKLLFIPPSNLVKRSRPKEVTEASAFLKKNWTDINEPTGKNVITYKMMKQD